MTTRDATSDGTGEGRRERGPGAAVGSGLNEVHLIGRIADVPEARTLPSGDGVVLVRMIVDRPAVRGTGGRQPSVDTIDCALWTAALRRRSGTLRPGAVVDLTGSLRRRFWRSASGLPQSRYEVEVSAFRVVRAAAVGTVGRRAP